MGKLVTASANRQLDLLLEIVCVKLQLSQTQFELAEERYHAIGDWLLAEKSPIRAFQPEIYPQGSLSLGTTVKPWGANEFDLDLVCQLQATENSHPGDVYSAIWDRMEANGTYRNMITRKPRCIRVEYANDFHLDIVPAIPDGTQNGDHILVPDLHADLEPGHVKNNQWKPSNPRGYKKWFRSKCVAAIVEKYAHAEPLPQPEAIHEKPSLKRAVQLFKRWRDVRFMEHGGLEPPSIILTTLAGHFHRGEMLCTDALQTIIDSTVAMRRDGKNVCLTNPANSKEQICERWTEKPASLALFDEAICEFQNDWAGLQAMRGLKEITDELKRLFGENPVDQAVKEFAERLVNEPRQEGGLFMEKQTRRIVTGTPVAALPVKETTFYGQP